MRIVCAGMRRSGSTWLYNVLRLITRAYGSTNACFEDTYTVDQAARHEVVKLHKFRQEYLFGARGTIYTSRRDLRDVVASAVRYGLVKIITPIEVIRFLAKAVTDEYDLWEPYSSFELVYEDMVADEPRQVRRIASSLQLKVDEKKIIQLLNALPLQTPADPEILLHQNHITDGRVGSYKETLPADVIKAIETIYGDWLVGHGYAI